MERGGLSGYVWHAHIRLYSGLNESTVCIVLITEESKHAPEKQKMSMENKNVLLKLWKD